MKKFLTLIILSFIFSCTPYIVNASDEVTVILDGEPLSFDVPAQTINGRTMVPARKIFEELGMIVDWDEETQTVSASKLGVSILLIIDDTTAYRNTIAQSIDVPAQIIDGRTLVPVRVISEYAGADIYWDAETNTVHINSTDNIKYINWNDQYYYYGETIDGKAAGYGILYAKSDNSVVQLGKYIDSKFVVGTEIFDNGDMYIGNYENGTFSYGTYYYYASGDSYTGEFKDSKKHGNGTYYYTNGSYHDGEWLNDMPNGYGIFYDSIEDVQFQGNFINGERVGDFVINDFYLDKVYYVTYEDEINNDTYTEENQSKELEEAYDMMIELEKEYAELEEWYQEQLLELYDYIKNGDPFSTEWAQSIYNDYGVSNGTSPADSNLDSFAAANAMRQNAALKAQADTAILQYNQIYIENQKQLIEKTYVNQKNILDEKKAALELKLQLLGE